MIKIALIAIIVAFGSVALTSDVSFARSGGGFHRSGGHIFHRRIPFRRAEPAPAETTGKCWSWDGRHYVWVCAGAPQ